MSPILEKRSVLGGLWRSPSRIAVTTMTVLLLAKPLWLLLSWGLLNAVFHADLQACNAVAGHGACWGVVTQKWSLILMGRIPEVNQPAAWVAVGILSILLWVSFRTRWAIPTKAVAWAIGLPLACALLSPIPLDRMGGLPLTLLLAIFGYGFALPLGLLLAVGRRSANRVLSTLCAVYIETCRALPLLTVLFLAAFVVPLVVPDLGGPLLIRVVVIVAIFEAAYLAEVWRGGLQALSQGQTDAGLALGMKGQQIFVWVVLPQVFRVTAPALLNSFVTLFKESSLVTVVSLFELSGSLSLALSGDVQWRQYYLEGYLFIALVYWLYCYGLARGRLPEKTIDNQ